MEEEVNGGLFGTVAVDLSMIKEEKEVDRGDDVERVMEVEEEVDSGDGVNHWTVEKFARLDSDDCRLFGLHIFFIPLL